jgi:hypothetical protein
VSTETFHIVLTFLAAIATAIIGATPIFMVAWFSYHAKEFSASLNENKALSVSNASTLEKVHVAVNSRDEAKTKLIADQTETIKRLSDQIATLIERMKGRDTADALAAEQKGKS